MPYTTFYIFYFLLKRCIPAYYQCRKNYYLPFTVLSFLNLQKIRENKIKLQNSNHRSTSIFIIIYYYKLLFLVYRSF